MNSIFIWVLWHNFLIVLTMRNFILGILLLSATGLYAQQKTSKTHYNVQVRYEEGDLNNDGITDKVVVDMDTVAATVPLRLQIFFGLPGGKFKLVVSSTKLIQAQYPPEKKGKHNGSQIPNFFVENGNLQMLSDLNDENAEHVFRYKNGHFELISAWTISYDGKDATTEIRFNLLTGLRTEKTQTLVSGKVTKLLKKKRMIRPLPRIQNLKASDLPLYL